MSAALRCRSIDVSTKNGAVISVIRYSTAEDRDSQTNGETLRVVATTYDQLITIIADQAGFYLEYRDEHQNSLSYEKAVQYLPDPPPVTKLEKPFTYPLHDDPIPFDD